MKVIITTQLKGQGSEFYEQGMDKPINHSNKSLNQLGGYAEKQCTSDGFILYTFG
jgi:hypothetical protein